MPSPTVGVRPGSRFLFLPLLLSPPSPSLSHPSLSLLLSLPLSPPRSSPISLHLCFHVTLHICREVLSALTLPLHSPLPFGCMSRVPSGPLLVGEAEMKTERRARSASLSERERNCCIPLHHFSQSRIGLLGKITFMLDTEEISYTRTCTRTHTHNTRLEKTILTFGLLSLPLFLTHWVQLMFFWK